MGHKHAGSLRFAQYFSLRICAPKWGVRTVMNIQKWEKTRRKGKAKFIWQNVILARVVPLSFIFTGLREITQPDVDFGVSLVIAIVIFSLVGMLVGENIWEDSEEKYLKGEDK